MTADIRMLLMTATHFSLAWMASAAPQCAVIEEGTCYPSHAKNNDIKVISNITDPATCCDLCKQNSKCGAFTLNYDGTPHTVHESLLGKVPRCILKAKVLAKASGNCTSGSINAPPPPPEPPHAAYCKNHTCRNVLYLVADDMRADWGSYGISGPVTPNFDALVAKSLRFTRAYCQISVCAPSRMSFMTSRRPDTNGVWNFIDTVPQDTQSTPGHFKDYGYITLGLGKTFHQDSGAWNKEKYWDVDKFDYYNYGVGKCPHGGQGGGHCVQKDSEIYDWHLKEQTLTELSYAIQRSKNESRPFYVMAGFRKPHAPWQAPQRMYDLYDQDKLRIAQHKVLPTGTPLIAWSNQLAVKLENGTSFHYGPTQPVPDWVMRDQRHAYYASISYVDEHVGAILEKLQQEGVGDNTLVVFHADHGYNMGEHGEWEKKSNFDTAVRVPLVIHAPWKGASAQGVKTDSLTELVDLMPTVAVLAGLPKPEAVDGDDVSALLDNPSVSRKAAAYHQYPACGCKDTIAVCFNKTRGGCNNAKKETFNAMGYTVRVDDWRYTAWFKWLGSTGTYGSDWNGPFAEELYDHAGDDSSDPDRFETENLAKAHPDVAKKLHAQLRKFFDVKAPRGLVLPTTEHQHVDYSDPYDLDFV